MPIQAFVGLPGSGKTYAVTRYAYRLRRRFPDRDIFSNYPLYLPGKPVQMLESIEDAFPLRDCVLILDEMHLWMSSRSWHKHSGPYEQWISQLRKVNVDLLYTSQEINSVDKLVRDRTYISYWLESFRALGFFYYSAYVGVREDKKKRYLRGWYWFNRRIASLYDTEYVVKL